MRRQKDKKPGRSSSGGTFEFKDRTGKIHGSGGGHNRSERSAEPRGPSPRRDFDRGGSKVGPGGGGGGASRFRDRDRDRDRGGRDRDMDQDSDRSGSFKTLKATVDKNRKGFGFLVFESKVVEDAFVPPREAEALFHGDRVEVVISGRGEIIRLKVIAHRFRELVGKYMPIPAGRTSKGAWVIYERKKSREEVFIADAHPTAKQGDWTKVKLAFHETGPYKVTGEIVEVYGPELPPSADVGMVAAEYNLIEEHSEAAEAEAKSFKLDASGPGRKDLKEIPFITIDGETARDFDDAIYVERSKSGHTLWVAIADVSHYVTHGSALDTEARSRGTSVYFPERAFHMLPRALSENLCSLRPNEPRLTLVARMEFDRAGKRTKTEVMEGVILSRRRATYNEIQAEWEVSGKDPAWEYAPHFELYRLIRKARNDRGSIDFDLPEAEVKVEPTGEVISIRHRPRLDAHRLIEEFMVGANEAVTSWMLDRAWPFVYRVHGEPSAQALQKFQKLAATVGVDVTLSDENLQQSLAEVIRKLDGNPAQGLLNMALLRSMQQAVYSADHGIHFGLASPGYTHFTSPIRRYPDLVVHRLLRWALQVERKEKSELGPKEKEKLNKELDDICEHCSYRERLASDAERESIKLKQVRAMAKHLGEEFEGSVIGMVESGLFVNIQDPYVEGLVTKDSMDDDYYEFNEERMTFAGRRKKRTFKIGDKVTIKVLRADVDVRQIDFGFVAGPHPREGGKGEPKGASTPATSHKFTRDDRSPRGGGGKNSRDRDRGGDKRGDQGGGGRRSGRQKRPR